MNKILAKLSSPIALFTIIALLIWLSGLPTWLHKVDAAAFSNVSVTLGDSDLGVATTNQFAFTVETALDDSGGADTIVITYDPTGSNFDVGIDNAADFTSESNIDIVDACGGGSNEFTFATTSETITFTICAGDSIAADTAVGFTIDNNHITNPNSANSYVIRVQSYDQGSTLLDTADPRVMIIDDVTVTADVTTSFTFTVSGVPIGLTVNGAATTTATTTTATELRFGTLASGTPKVLAQRLNVSTNAKNGFVVTVVGDGPLDSVSGGDIDQFKNGAVTATPETWVGVHSTLNINDENTWGHYGITSEDSDLNGDEFGSNLWAGDFATSTRQIFSHSGPSDGTTADMGSTTVAYQIEISDLQEAADDYTQVLTYVATPTF